MKLNQAVREAWWLYRQRYNDSWSVVVYCPRGSETEDAWSVNELDEHSWMADSTEVLRLGLERWYEGGARPRPVLLREAQA